MTTIPQLPLAEVTAIALRILIQGIGVVNTARFINQYTHGFGDYTKERDALFKDVAIDDIVSAIQQQKNEGNDE